MSSATVNQLSLEPLGAGDLIDRAVRLYRRHFITLIRIAAPPVIISALGSVLITIGSREFTGAGTGAALAFYVLLIAAGMGFYFVGTVFSLIVMGGATRNLVTHLLWNEPVTASATYAAVRSRFWSLLGASLVVTFWLFIAGMVAGVGWYMAGAFSVLGAILLATVLPGWMAVIVGVIAGVGATALGVWIFFFLAGRVAYVPQAMLVEGKGIFEAVSRSFSLARGNVRRLMAMTLFTSFATYSALMILLVPLGFVAWIAGISLSPFNQSDWPAWYSVAYNVISQSSYLLLAPIWMLGLSLLYVDERVRHEGYDIELMAARQLTEMPALRNYMASPFGPAIVMGRAAAVPPPPLPRSSILGLG
ncbi:MAG: hypothetical protein QOD75_601 [Blastocatellia bacterium]|jgi:hypothetical protein|nr:hypothetical protein [Blastocatellia bacterium]